MTVYSVDKLITEARRLASEYRKATGKPLGGVSGQIAEYDAVRLLDLELIEPRLAGYDAIGHGAREGKRVQIKGRAIFDELKTGQRIGQLKMEQEWDSVVLVLMDENHEACEIYEAERRVIEDAVGKLSDRRNKRGALSVAKFKNIGRLVWSKDSGLIESKFLESQASNT